MKIHIRKTPSGEWRVYYGPCHNRHYKISRTFKYAAYTACFLHEGWSRRTNKLFDAALYEYGSSQ